MKDFPNNKTKSKTGVVSGKVRLKEMQGDHSAEHDGNLQGESGKVFFLKFSFMSSLLTLNFIHG